MRTRHTESFLEVYHLSAGARETGDRAASKRPDAGMDDSVLALLFCAVIFGVLTLVSVVEIVVERRSARAIVVEKPYVMGAEDATRFEQIVAAIFTADPDFEARCRQLLDHGE